MTALAPTAALWFLIPVVPLAFIAAFNDLKHMRLPNVVVIALALVFVLIGPFVLPLSAYGWGFVHAAVMYLVGMFAFAYLGVGAGDGKFAAAFSMFVPFADAGLVLTIFAGFLLGAFAAHRLVRLTPIATRLTPDWKSWTHKKFPMGLALSGTAVGYLSLAAFTTG